MRTREPFLPRPQHGLTQNTFCNAGVVFDAQLSHNLAVYAPNVDLDPITASVAAIYPAVSPTERPNVIHACVASVGVFHLEFWDKQKRFESSWIVFSLRDFLLDLCRSLELRY